MLTFFAPFDYYSFALISVSSPKLALLAPGSFTEGLEVTNVGILRGGEFCLTKNHWVVLNFFLLAEWRDPKRFFLIYA